MRPLMPASGGLWLAMATLSTGAVAGCAHGTGAAAAARTISPAASPAGSWDGIVRVPGAAPIAVAVVLDSSAGAWRGTLVAAALGAQPVALVSVRRTGDSVEMHLPAAAQHATMRGRLSADGRAIEGVVEVPHDATPGTFHVARSGTPEAAALVGYVRRVEESRRVAQQAASEPATPPHADPDSARLITSDIPRFWSIVDRASPDSLAALLQREYLDQGTVGVRDFIRGRILSAEDLAASVLGQRARYDSTRAAMFEIERASPAIHAAFRRLKELYPDAVFPDVYFVVGRFNSGGTSTQHGLLIGAEMYRDPGRLPAIVSHELIHFQQHGDGHTLLEQSFMEGSADFLGEMISGAQINSEAHRYGMAHEHELWREFSAHFDDHQLFPWMYGKPPDGRPNDLGYFIGYRIAQAYYDRAPDKAQAIRDIIAASDVTALLARSGYAP